MKHVFFMLLTIVLFYSQPIQCGRSDYSSLKIDQAKIDLVRMYGLRWYLLRHIGWDDETESGQLHDTIINRIAYYATPEITPEMKAFILSKIIVPHVNLRTPSQNLSPVRFITLSKDGKHMATNESETIIQLWDPVTFQKTDILESNAPISGLAYHPNNGILAVASHDRTINLWDSETKECRMSFTGHRGKQSLAFSKEGRFIAAGSTKNTIKIWNTATGLIHKMFTGHTQRVRFITLCSSTKRQIASASVDETIKILNQRTQACVATLKGHTKPITALLYSRIVQQLISGSEDCTIRLWDVDNNHCVTTLRGHEGPITSLARHPTEPLLLSGSADGAIKLWDLKYYYCLKTFSNNDTGPITSLAYLYPLKTEEESQQAIDYHFISARQDGTLQRWDLSLINRFMRIMDSPTAEQAIALTTIATSRLCNRTMVKDLARQGINAKPLKKYFK